MDNFDLRKFLAEGKLYEANSPELDKAKEDYMAGKISLADHQAIVKKLDFKGVKDAEAKAQAKADAIAAEKKELEDKKAKVKQAEKDLKAGKISQEEFAKVVQANQYVNKESLNEETEALDRESVIDMAQMVADEFTEEDANVGGTHMIYKVGKVDGLEFELDTQATENTPADDAKYGTGEGWGGSFRIEVLPNGYEIRNTEKGGLVATMDMEDGFRMLSPEESRAELLGEPDVDYKNDELDMKRMEEGEEVAEAQEEVAEYSSKMKKSELKEMIRQSILAETGASLTEEEEDEKDVDVDADVDVDIDADVKADEDEIIVKQDADTDLGGTVGDVQDNLEAALEAARELGDEKLEDQIGNTLTFFTRTHVVGK